jgi:putative hemolysin
MGAMTRLDVDHAKGLRHVTAQESGAGLKIGRQFAELADGPVRPGAVLGRKGTMLVRLAVSREEIEASQRLRYEVFYQERSALADEVMALTGRDQDAFDDVCDHMLVIDSAGGIDLPGLVLGDGTVVGTYRLLRQEVAEAGRGFYSAAEFDIAPLIEAKRGKARFLELGRSCVLKPYRTKPTVELLWQGIWNYVRLHRFDVMFGCGSLDGVDPQALALPLSFLHHQCRAPDEWQVRALPDRYVEMNRLPADAVDMREAMKLLPPLIKGYLRVGAYFGDGAVVDHQFNTTDVLIVMPVSAINARYFSHFGAPGEVPV